MLCYTFSNTSYKVERNGHIMSRQLEGKVALVTGGGRGIGAAITVRFVAEGAKVVITGRQKESLMETASILPEGAVHTIAGDVGNPDDAKAMVEAAIAFGGKIDILVNNAAVDFGGSVVDLPIERWANVIDTNLNGPFYMMKYAIPYMIDAGGGSIINISSVAGIRRIPSMPALSASKAGLIGLSEAVAFDYGKYNIRSNVICPGATRKVPLKGPGGSIGTLKADRLDELTRFNPIPRPATSEHVAAAVLFFASDESVMITGTVLPVDSGASIVDPNGVSMADKVWGSK